MSIFNKNKEEEYEDEEEIRPRYPKDKAFRDLKSANKRKRKEPIRAWNKKDRILLFLLMALTVGTSAYLALSARDFKLPGIPRLSFSIYNLFGEEKIVIEKDKGETEMAQKITEKFRQKTKDLSGVYGLYIINLNSSFSFGVYEEDIFQAASLIKLPAMIAMYMEDEEGLLSLDTKYRLKNEDKVPGAGILYAKPAGYEISYRDLIRLMGKQSDNTAFNIVRKTLGDEKINTVIGLLRMKNTSLEKNETTPKDMAVLFAYLWRARQFTDMSDNGSSSILVSKKSADEMLDYLTDTSFENWLAAGIPEEVRITHKYGREVHVVNDAGIVFSKNPYIVVIMTKGVVEREADESFPELSKLIYGQINPE